MTTWWRTFVDRWIEVRSRRGLVLVSSVIGCIVVGGGLAALAVVLLAPSGSSSMIPVVTPTTIPMVVTSTTLESGPAVVVHATGAVRSPGVYRLPQGSRVVDLLERAGGPGDGLDLDRVNLAAQLADGSRVWFPIVGQQAPGEEPANVGGATGPPAKIDLNHASASELTGLPGVGPATAAAIIARRTTVGPFRSVDDLLSVKGLGRSKVEAIRPLVRVG